MKIGNGESLLLTGDSITDCGRDYPVGMGDGLGNGYVALVDALLAVCYPQRNISVMNTGISGNRVTDLEARWQADVLDLGPDWLSVMIGINDVWRQFDNALDPDQVEIAQFESTYRSLLTRTRPSMKGLILLSPYCIEPNVSDPMRSRMDAYTGVVKRLAHSFDGIFVDVQDAFDRYLVHQPAQSLCSDRVHPNTTGHTIIANAFLTAVGFDWTLAAGSIGKAGN